MRRRLLAQFGLSALIMALGTGAAFADTAPAITPTPTDPGQTVVANTTSVSVDTTHSSTTSVGTSVGGSSSTGTDGTPPSVTPPPTGTGTDSGSSTEPPSTDGTSGPTTPSTNLPTSTTTPTVTAGPSTSGTTTPVGPATNLVAHNSFVASFERVAYVSGLTPVEPILATSIATGLGHPGRPAAPPSPMELLYQLHVLLISTLVPAIRFIPAAIQGAASSQAGLAMALVIVLSCLASRGLVTSTSSYTARLRRSGFLGGARSDVASLLLFATPREMSSIGAGAPG